MERKPFRIAVVGGGIGGLCFASALAKLIPEEPSRYIVDIYESTSSLEAQVGAGIRLWAYAWGVLEHLGIDKELAKYTTSTISDEPLPFFKVRKSDQPQGKDLFTLQSSSRGIVLFRRADLQATLLRSIPSRFRIHTGKRLRSYSQGQDEVLITFEDGSTATCDFLVGADGLQSNVRRTMMRELLQRGKIGPDDLSNQRTSKEEYLERLCNPYWIGSIIYRELIPTQKLIDAGWGHHPVLKGEVWNAGRNGGILSYLVAGGSMINFAALKGWLSLNGSVYHSQLVDALLRNETSADVITKTESSKLAHRATAISNERDPWAENGGGGVSSDGRARWVKKVGRKDVKASFGHWEEEVQALIDCLETPLQWSIHVINPLPTFQSGMVCLLGDAAHAMPPYLGQGSGQAISDAFVLAKLVAAMMEDRSSNPKTQLNAALSAYDTIRRPIAQSVAELSQCHGMHWFLRNQDADGRVVDVDTDDREQLDALRESLTRNWSIGWDKSGPLGEAERAVDWFKRMRVVSVPPLPVVCAHM